MWIPRLREDIRFLKKAIRPFALPPPPGGGLPATVRHESPRVEFEDDNEPEGQVKAVSGIIRENAAVRVLRCESTRRRSSVGQDGKANGCPAGDGRFWPFATARVLRRQHCHEARPNLSGERADVPVMRPTLAMAGRPNCLSPHCFACWRACNWNEARFFSIWSRLHLARCSAGARPPPRPCWNQWVRFPRVARFSQPWAERHYPVG